MFDECRTSGFRLVHKNSPNSCIKHLTTDTAWFLRCNGVEVSAQLPVKEQVRDRYPVTSLTAIVFMVYL
jgi:hypothetical protein